MPEAHAIRVTPDEEALLTAIREIPEGPLRKAFEEIIGELADVITNPRCPEVQADGVPCQSLGTDCEHCLGLEELLGTLRGALRTAV